MNLLKITIFQIISLLLVSNVFAATTKEPKTKITSDVIDIKRKAQITEFIGNVVVKRAADTMSADRMVVYYTEKNPTASVDTKASSIKKIEAKNNVKIFSSEFVANGNSGYYNPSENIFVLEDTVVVNDGSSIGRGDKFIYNLLTKKGNFVGKKEEEKVKTNKDNRVVVIIGDDIKEKK